jgi:hypothetical protein
LRYWRGKKLVRTLAFLHRWHHGESVMTARTQQLCDQTKRGFVCPREAEYR